MADVGLAVVALASLALAVLHACGVGTIDTTTVQLLLVAFAAAGFSQLKSFKLTKDGIEAERLVALEKKAEEVEKRVQEVDDSVAGAKRGSEQIAKLLGPIAVAAPAAAVVTARGVARGTSTATSTSDDPNKGQFGGKPVVNGRSLSAHVEELESQKGWYLVTLTARSTEPARPLVGSVVFHLHPTFPSATVTTPALNGEGVLSFKGWGAFTVGAEVDEGSTRLELDLASEAVGAPAEFRRR